MEKITREHVLKLRTSNDNIVSQFTNCDFTDVDLSGLHFFGAAFFECKFYNTSFRNSTFRNVKMRVHNMSNVDFAHTHWESSYLLRGGGLHSNVYAEVTNCSFFASSIEDVTFGAVTLGHCDFRKVKFVNVKFTGTAIEYSDFSKANLHEVCFYGSFLQNVIFKNAVVPHLVIYNSKVQDCNFDYSEIKFVQLYNALLSMGGAEFLKCKKLFVRSDINMFHILMLNKDYYTHFSKCKTLHDLYNYEL